MMRRPGSLPKYKNHKTVVDGVTFDSMAEAKRWQELLLLQRAGLIANLRRQVAFELAPSVKYQGATRAKPALRYVADFCYTELATGRQIIEDTKGMKTRAYDIKKHLMKHLFNYDILES